MTIPEEIEALKVKLEQTAGEKEQAVILLDVIRKYSSINDPDSKPFIDRLLEFAENFNEPFYKAWGVLYLAINSRLNAHYDVALTETQLALAIFEQQNIKAGIVGAYNNMGIITEERGNGPQALEYYQKAVQIATACGDNPGAARAYNNIGRHHYNQLNYPEALKYHLQALQLREELGDKKGISDSCFNLALIYEMKSNLTEALEIHSRALTYREEIGDKKGNAISYRVIGNIQWHLGNYGEARTKILQSLQAYQQLGDKAGVANAYNHIGMIEARQGNYAEGLKNFFQALQINDETGHQEIWAYTVCNIGYIYENLENYNEAISYYSKSQVVFNEMGDLVGRATLYNSFGDIYQKQQNYSEALKNYEAAFKLFEEIGDKEGMAYSYNNIGIIHERQNNNNEALAHHLTALKLRDEIGDQNGVAVSHGHIGRLHLKRGNHEPAYISLQQALNLAEKIGDKRIQSESLHSLYTLKKAAGDTSSALDYHEKYTLLKNELDNTETSKQIANLKIGHDLELKEKEKQLVEKILHNILPEKIAGRIKNGEEEIIEKFENCSVLFADIVGFTSWSEKQSVQELAQHLNRIFSLFDGLATQFGVEKIKTIGDAYMCVAGLPEPCENHSERIAQMALAMNEKVKEVYPGGEIKLRIGVHTGEVVAGVIGKNKYAYDLWGDTVNTASRMESHSVADKIQVSEQFRNLLVGKFKFEYRGEIEVKGKGRMRTYFLVS
jgi:adenylate cyclase